MMIDKTDNERAEQINTKSRTENSVNNITTGIVSQAVTLILQFVYRTIFIQILGVTYLSVNGLFSNILTIFSFAELGIGQAIIFSLYKPIRENDIPKIRGLMELYKRTYRVIGIFIFCVGIVFMPFLQMILKGSADGIDNLYLIYALFVFDSGISYFFSYRQSYLTACQQQYYLNVYSCIFSFIREVVRISVILITKQYIPVLIFSCVWTFVQNVIYSQLIVRRHPYIRNTKGAAIEPDEKRTIIKNIKALIIYKVGTLALSSTDNIIITSVVGLTWVGLYSNYSTLVSSVGGFISLLFSSLTASIGNLNAGEDIAKKKFMFRVINLATFWVYAMCSVCFLISLTPTIQIWIGDEWTLDFATSVVIATNIYVGGMLYTPFNYRQTLGLFVYGKWRPICSAVINIVVSIILGKYFGLKGVLAGTIIARLTTNAWFDPYIVYRRGFKESPLKYFSTYILYFALYGLSCVVGIYISRIYVLGGLFDILLHCVMCFGLLSGFYFLLLGRTEEFRYLTDAGYGVCQNYFKKFKK